MAILSKDACVDYELEALLRVIARDYAKEGFLMPSIPNSGTPGSTDFQKITNAFIAAERIAAVVTRHQNLFDVDAVYSTAVMAWSFLG